ncbi:MAG: phosphonate metabolism transcriptional regulator PhnF [Neomegalonema sp.]|nr:phosphonate metabolism transcriptional regulator PhnF [Neomegalonema sp.]
MPRTPIWREIYDALRAEVVDGSFKAGDKLPTEKELSERFEVNRHTVRRALAELSLAGIIAVRRGSGAYVSEGVLDYKIGPRTRFSQNVAELGRTPSQRLMSADMVSADPRIAEKLAIKAGKPVVMIEQLGEADNTPVCASEHYFNGERFPDLAEVMTETKSVTAALRRYGVIDYVRAWTRIAAVAPSRTIARKLRQPDNAPVLRAEALNLDMAGQPIEYGVTYFAGQRAALMVDSDSYSKGGEAEAPRQVAATSVNGSGASRPTNSDHAAVAEAATGVAARKSAAVR